MSLRTAIVTMTIGEPYVGRWETICRPGWERYAARHGYELIRLAEPLDLSPRGRARSPAWQKCLILGLPRLRDYDRVVWIDADVLINPWAPAITEGIAPEKVGAVDEFATPVSEAHRRHLRPIVRVRTAGHEVSRPETAAEYHAAAGLPAILDRVVQTGIMVLSPIHHRHLLEGVYDSYEDPGPKFDHEMRPLSFELQRGGCMHWLDSRFNALWPHVKAQDFPALAMRPRHPRAASAIADALSRVHMLHFAGSGNELESASSEPPARPRRRRAPVSRPPLRTPVVLFLFSRPETSAPVLDAIRAVRPEDLLVVADAPRPKQPADVELCAAARALVDTVDWPCKVVTNYAEEHLGLKLRIETGLAWAFEHLEEAIILEDDCVPHPSFFSFCEHALERFRDEPQVMSISGTNVLGRDAEPNGYTFSRYPMVWGWATWRRAWALHDPAMDAWPSLRDTGFLANMFEHSAHAVQYWTHLLDRTRREQDTWDYGWALTCWRRNGLSIRPGVNLVTNVGFGPGATHTHGDLPSPFAQLTAHEMTLPPLDPPEIVRDADADALIEDVLFSGNVARMIKRVRAAHDSGAVRRP